MKITVQTKSCQIATGKHLVKLASFAKHRDYLNFLKVQLKLLLIYLISYFKTHEPSLLQLSSFPQHYAHSQRIAQFIKEQRKQSLCSVRL